MTMTPTALATSNGSVTFRRFDPAVDWRIAAELLSTVHEHDGIDYRPNAEVLAHEWKATPGFDAVDDALIAESDGEVVGLAAVEWRARGPNVVHELAIWVRPTARRRGIGAALAVWGEEHARGSVAAGRGAADLPHVLGGWADADVPGHAQLAATRGFRPFRYGFEMRRPVEGPIPDAPLPPGLEVREVRPEQYRAIWDADAEAFRDHFEAARRTEEDFEQWFSSPWLDTTLWQVAWHGEEVAGSVLTSIMREENERLGLNIAWLDHISVRRPWRGRGLASALIGSTLRLLSDHGVEIAALGVDAENPTGALHVYERMGFRRHKTGVSYRKAF
jgi:mycothiol synthase